MKRYYYIIISLLTLACQAATAQTASKNYVMTETMLDSSGTRRIVSVQYYDGLGRPSELAEGGIRTDGKYLHSLQTYDSLGRESITTLPAAATSSPTFQNLTPTSSAISQSYSGDTRPFSHTTYDALNRPTFISTPGQNWTGKGKTMEYLTNGENEVKQYKPLSSAVQLNGYYPAGSLTAERVTDEDGISASTYKDLMGRVVLERRGNNDDTYYVYDAKGLLRFVLQPMYQESPNFKNRFQYTYDSRGRMTNKYLPGCDPIKYYYDGANRMIALQEPSRGDTVCTRHFFYDGLGRLTIQARSFATPSNSSKKLITTRTAGQNAVEIAHTGYYIKNYNIPASLQVEIVNYYDDYAFLTSGIFTDSVPGGNFQVTNTVCTSTLKTGDITATSDGHLLARVYYYDDKGRVIDTRENLLGGKFLRTTSTYSFTDKPLTVQKTISGSSNWNIAVTEDLTYDGNTDKQTFRNITHNGVNSRVAAYFYDDLGRLSTKVNDYWFLGSSYSYNIHGWLTSLGTVNLDNNYQNVFSQDIYYETGSGQPCYNGNISSMRWKTGADDPGRGYKFIYDLRNRMTQANHTFFDMSDYPISNSERVTYNRNSAPLTLTRMGGATGLVLDSLTYTYNGNLLKSINDVSSHTVSSGLFEFVDGANKVTEYKFNDAGDLVWDYNKGIASIKYDYLGHPVRIQFTNRNLVEYVYAADGRKLREKHTTAVEGLHMNMGQAFNLLPSQILSVDSMDYAGNIRYRWQNLHNVGDVYNFWYHFDDGYLAVMPAQTSPTAYHYIPSYHYQVRDHQGNIRVVVDEVGNLEQKNEYFAYGGPWVSSTNQGFQPFKYNGKELDRVHGLDWYDYGSRRYDPAFCMFTQIDPLAEKYPHLNPYVYCAGNPVRYVDPDGKKPKPYEAALMAAYVYGDGNSKSYARSLAKEGWIVSSFNTSISNESKNGLQGKLFEKTKDGVTEYAYAYAGTDINSIADIIADITQVAGLSSQYKMAIDNAKTLSTEIGDNELTFVGHSLGGGEAAAASMATGRAAITFNPAAVSNSTRLYNLLGSSRQIENYRSVWWKSGMLKLGFGGDPLNILQDRFKMKAPGRTHLVQIGLKKPLASHSIESIIDKLWEME